MATKYVTVMLVPDGTESRRQWRIPNWVLRLVVGSVIFVLVGIVVFFALYGKVLSRAAMTEKLQAENESLRRYRYKVQLLEENLMQARTIVSKLTRMAGVDFEFPEMPDDSSIFSQLDGAGVAIVARSAGGDYSTPEGMPIEGFVTQQYDVEGDHYHPGIDIACAVGTPVLATGSAVAEYIGYDSLYGNMMVLRHNDSVTTVYGHLEKTLVDVGQPILVGSRIALSGNTGQSTAPHLHYEIRIYDEPINPLDNPYDEENKQQ